LLKDFGEAYSSGTVQDFHLIPYSFVAPDGTTKTNATQRYKKSEIITDICGIYLFPAKFLLKNLDYSFFCRKLGVILQEFPLL
jgi:hypothetical protein